VNKEVEPIAGVSGFPFRVESKNRCFGFEASTGRSVLVEVNNAAGQTRPMLRLDVQNGVQGVIPTGLAVPTA
jgi:hypothetical protein